MKKLIPLLSVLLSFAWISARGAEPEGAPGEEKLREIVTFRFSAGDDMFRVRENEGMGDNGQELERLYLLIDRYMEEITQGGIPVYVDAYSASMREQKANLNLSYVRANRVKSELITRKGLTEENFITTNHAKAYTDPGGVSHKDMVVVTLLIPSAPEDPRPTVCPLPEVVEEDISEHDISEDNILTSPDTPPVADSEQKAASWWPNDHYLLAVRTNLLYDGFGLPTLGIEWRVNRHLGLKLDGSRSWWGNAHGKVQKIWLLSPELRWYLLDAKRFYVGVSGNYGEYNVYKYLIGGMASSDTGYQGNGWNAGVTVGYQLYLTRCLSLDFNLGLGYSHAEYDTFAIDTGERIYKDRDRTKNFFGPTQAGISLVWTIGGRRK